METYEELRRNSNSSYQKFRKNINLSRIETDYSTNKPEVKTFKK